MRIGNYIKIKDEIDYFVSFGLNCCSGIVLQNTKLRKEALPFDNIVSSPKVIYDCLINNFKDFTEFNDKNEFLTIDSNIKRLFELSNTDLTKHTNNYGIYFNHYLNRDINDIKNTFTRRIDRFFNLLKTCKKIVFIYSTELCIYDSKFREDQNEYYNYLIKIQDFLLENFKDLNFKILCFNCNVTHVNTSNIYNIDVLIEKNKISDNWETHDIVYPEYRLLIENAVNNIFNN